jgi:hypothetical protein
MTRLSIIQRTSAINLVALSILLAGFIPYLSHAFDADVVYRGG